MSTKSMQRPLAITGLGVVSPIGNNILQLEASLLSGKNGITTNEFQNTEGYRSHVCGQIKNLTLSDGIQNYLGRKTAAVEQYAFSAVEQAWQQAGLDDVDGVGEETGIILGSGGSIVGLETYIKQHLAGEVEKPAKLLNYSPDSAGTAIANYFKLRGPRSSIMTACSSGATAIGYAADIIRSGHAKVMVAGGVESLSTVTLSGFNSLGALSESLPKPFDAHRDGIALGEGAGVLILEDYEHAVERGATILAEFSGYGFSADGHHMTAPHPEGEGMISAMTKAMNEASVAKEDIYYINAHGTGTELNDKSETAAVQKVFEEHSKKLCMSSTKSMIGHTLSAAGAIEAVVTCLALKGQFAPPTINYETFDEACAIDCVPNESRNLSMNYAMSNSLAFGGNNTSLIFKRTN